MTSPAVDQDGRGQMAHRLFFALWPSQDLLDVLKERIPALLPARAGRVLRPEQWHVTLEFLGHVADGRLADLQEIAATVRGEPTEVQFDRLEHWRRPQLLCLTASRPPAALLELALGLREVLRRDNFRTDARDFRPHLTLARNVRRAPGSGPIDPVAWPADGFALVESITDPAGAIYRPIRHWPLRGGSAEE